jgi:sortase A
MDGEQTELGAGRIARVSGSIVDDEATPPPPNEAVPSKTTSRRRPSPLTLLGIGLLVAGLACLGWVGFQYFGTNVVSERAFESEAERLRARWNEENQSDPQGKRQASAIPGEAIALLRIPAFGADYEIPILNGTDLSILSKGVGHYSSTAAPGQIGNFAIAGHRVTHGQPFAGLLDLKQGDEIIVETRDAVYTYVLDDSPRQLTVKDTDTWVIDPVPGRPDAKPTQPLITLTTCQDLFQSSDRSVGFGHLANTQNK